MRPISGSSVSSVGMDDLGPPRTGSYAGQWRDLLESALQSQWQGVKEFWRANALYRLTLNGPMPDRLTLAPEDFQAQRLEDADAMFRGRFRLPGGTVVIAEGALWDAASPNESWAEELHGFGWIRHFALAGGEASSTFVRNAVREWLKRYAEASGLSWRPHVIARRLAAWSTYTRLVISSNDMLWRSQVLHSMARQARHLARTLHEAPEGEPRLAAAIGLALMGLVLPDGAHRLKLGLEATARELARQILPDGGHVSRNPEVLLRILMDLMTLAVALRAQNRPVPDEIQSGIDRMAPMLRFFRHGDGRLAVFNGGGEGAEKSIDAVLARDDAQGRPFGFAPHSGYQRLTAGKTLVLMDTGAPPPPAFSQNAHAGALSFEMSSGPNRIIVNCGTTLLRGPEWREACRQTQGHSTLGLDGASSAQTVSGGLVGRLLGPRLILKGGVASRRKEEEHGIFIDASHRGYAASHGLIHERRLFLSSEGDDLRGEDKLVRDPQTRLEAEGRVRFSVRFHVHPDVRASMAQDGSVLLRLPGGEGWRLRAAGGTVGLEESIYLGAGDPIRRTEQIVVTGDGLAEPPCVKWAIKTIAPE